MPFTATVITTKEWGAVPPKEWAEQTRPQFVIIHHTATPNPPNDISYGTSGGAKEFARNIQAAHMEGFDWADSGHNFLNTTGGFLLEGRQGTLNAIKQGLCVRSAHAGTPKGNESPGIENEGTFNTYQMKTQQWNSLVDLCVSICSSCKIDPENIKGHRDFIETQCPGDWLYSQLPRLRNEVRQKLDGSIGDFLKEGSSGPKVTQLQELLKAKGFNPGPIDGTFGSGTVKAVISFQKYEGLTPDGLVGSATWKALTSSPPINNTAPAVVSLIEIFKFYRGLSHQDKAIEWLQGKISPQVLEEFYQKWRNQPSPTFLPLKEGASGPEVQQLQERLQKLGFYKGKLDGSFGSGTKSSVIAFQQAKGLVADGIVGTQTWNAVNT